MSIDINRILSKERVIPKDDLRKYNRETYIFDLEIYKNYSLFKFRSVYKEEEDLEFSIIADQNETIIVDDTPIMVDFLKQKNIFLVGFNNYSYDDLIIKILVERFEDGKEYSPMFLYRISSEILIKKDSLKSDSQKDYIKHYRYRVDFPYQGKTIDLRHLFFSNKNSMKSLKEIGCSLGVECIQDLPYEFDSFLTDEQIRNISIYCRNDLDITSACFNFYINQIRLYEHINAKCFHNIDVQGLTEVKAATDWILYEYTLETGLSKKNIQNLKSVKKSIRCRDIIPQLEFKTNTLKEVIEKIETSLIFIDPERFKKYDDDIRYANYTTSQMKIKFDFAGITIKLGVGGCHTVDYPCIRNSDQEYSFVELDIDAAYPSIIEKHKIFPKHLNEVFNKIYCKSVEDRRKIKQQLKIETDPDKKEILKSDNSSLKLRNNGVFGQMLYLYSPLYCPQSGYQVTLSCQIYLLYLVESMHLAGVETVSVNTDGIVLKVKNSDLELMRQTAKNWENETQLKLEETIYKSIHRHDVNNYLAFKENGTVKQVGSFRSSINPKQANSALVVPLAVKEYFEKGIPVEQTIRECKDISKFCYYVKATKNFKNFLCTQNLTEYRDYLQKTVRWYIGNNDNVLYKERVDVDIKPGKVSRVKIGDVTKIPDSVGCIISNYLPLVFPDDINYDHYIQKAKKHIQKCELSKVVDFHTKTSEHLKQLGLFPLPKVAKYNPKDCNVKGPLYDWKWFRFNSRGKLADQAYYPSGGLYTGIVAGVNTKTCAIDIDIPKASKEIIYLLEQVYKKQDSFGLYSWRSENSLISLFEAKETFKVVFFVNEENIEKYRNSPASWKNKYGFEFFYGSTVTVWGKSNDEIDYRIEGSPIIIPPDIENFILEKMPKTKIKKKKKIAKETANNIRPIGKHQGTVEEKKDFREDVVRARKIIEELLPDYDLKESNLVDKFEFRGYCPFSDEHTNNNNETDFDISLFHGEDLPIVGCFHNSCANSIKKLRTDFLIRWKEERIGEIQDNIVSSVETEDIIEEYLEKETIREAFNSGSKHLLVTAPTGSGKTYESAKYIIERCKQKKPTVYVASNKLEVAQIEDLIKNMCKDKNDFENLFIEVLQSEEKLEIEHKEGDEKEKSVKIGKNTLAILTNHTYFTRKGDFSNVYYSVLNWIKQSKAHIIIDEFDNFIDKSSYTIDYGARYREKRRKHFEENVFEKVNTCPKFSGTGNCKNCYYRVHQSLDMSSHHLPYISTKNRIISSDFEKENHVKIPKWNFSTEIIESPTRGKKGGYYVTEYRNIKTHQNYLEKKEFIFKLKEDEVYKPLDIFSDLSECSYFPTIQKEFATYKGEKVTQKQILELTEEERSKVVWPHKPCNVPQITFKDKSVLFYIKKNCDRVIALTATITDTAKEFVKSIIPNITHINIENTTQGIDNLLIVGYPGVLNTVHGRDIFTHQFRDFGKTLIFQTTQKKSEYLFRRFPKNYPVALYKESSILREDKFTERTTTTIITNSRGALGRGISLESIYVTICNSLPIKPNCAFDLNSTDIETIGEKQNTDRLQLVEQNLGRSLRGSGNKVHILYNCDIEDIVYLQKKFSSLVKGKIETFIVEEKQDVKKIALDFLKQGEIKEEEKVEIEKSKPKFNIEEMKKELERYKGLGFNWSKSTIKASLQNKLRLVPKDQRKDLRDTLKSFFLNL